VVWTGRVVSTGPAGEQRGTRGVETLIVAGFGVLPSRFNSVVDPLLYRLSWYRSVVLGGWSAHRGSIAAKVLKGNQVKMLYCKADIGVDAVIVIRIDNSVYRK
jgi:hypothetical protein